MRRVDRFIQEYGQEVGPKLYRTMQSRAAYKGVSTKLRKKIAGLKAEPVEIAASAEAGPKVAQGMLPLSPDEVAAESGPLLATA